MTASVRELKARLSRYLKRAAAGEEVTVTSRGRAVARLIGPVQSPSTAEPSREVLRRRIASIPGIILPTGPKPRGSKNPIRIRKGEKTLADIVLEERR